MDMKTPSIDLAALEPPPAVAAIRRINDGFKNFQALHAGYASGLFDWLAQHGLAEKSAIADALKLRGAHLGAYLQTLEDLGLLARENGAYRLAPGAADALCAASPWCQSASSDILLSPSCGWSNMARFLAEGWGPTAAPAPSIALHPFLGEARRLAAALAGRGTIAGARTLLCFDGSDGLLTAALCQRHPQLHATVTVMPEARVRTETILADCGLDERCRVVAGSPLDPPPRETCKGFDYVVLFHSLYPVRKQVADALAAVTGCLSRGGELCSAHWFCLEACETAPGGLRDLDKAVLTDSHPLCHVEQFCQRLSDAGLVETERDDLAGEYGNTKLHFGRRPTNDRGGVNERE